MFSHLTTHSAFSLQEGLPLPADLVDAAQADGMPALGLTDHRLLSGSLEFVTACRRAGIQPVLGLEIDVEPGGAGPAGQSGRLALLATSLEGWSNLCRLSSALALAPDPEAACPLELLATFSRDLIALSGDQGDPNGSWLRPLQEIFPGRMYLALRDPSIGLQLADLGRRQNLPLVVAHPV